MKKGLIILTSCLVLFFVVALVFNMVRFQYGFNDALARTLLAPIEGTVWPVNFSEDSFARVKIGMTMDEVTSLLGKPIRDECFQASDGPVCAWKYTIHEIVEHYDRRYISFGSNNRVQMIQHDFYVD